MIFGAMQFSFMLGRVTTDAFFVARKILEEYRDGSVCRFSECVLSILTRHMVDFTKKQWSSR